MGLDVCLIIRQCVSFCFPYSRYFMCKAYAMLWIIGIHRVRTTWNKSNVLSWFEKEQDTWTKNLDYRIACDNKREKKHKSDPSPKTKASEQS